MAKKKVDDKFTGDNEEAQAILDQMRKANDLAENKQTEEDDETKWEEID